MGKFLEWRDFEHLISREKMDRFESYQAHLIYEETKVTGIDPITGEEWKGKESLKTFKRGIE